MAEFSFTNEYSASQREGALDVIRRPRLWIPETDYPDYFEWTEKVEGQLLMGEKRSMVASCGLSSIGAIIYQRHTDIPNTIELKNISVQPDQRGRYVGSFLLRNVEIEASNNDYPECDRIVVDTKANNNDMIGFLVNHGYSFIGLDDLYGHQTGEDAVFSKIL